MIKSKYMNFILGVCLCFAIVVSVALVLLANSDIISDNLKESPEYEQKIFGNEMITIEILADETEWQAMLDNAISEQYIMVDVVINGTKFEKVGIRPKGNSSLFQVANSDSNRYSFRLQFDEYIKGQTCFGLNSFVVNNMLGDNTYMKEYISYDLMKEIGVDAPYFGYANIELNGENLGLYLAVELYNDSYEQRVYGKLSGMLYNVKGMEVGGGNMPPMGEGNMPPEGRPPLGNGNMPLEGRPQWDNGNMPLKGLGNATKDLGFENNTLSGITQPVGQGEQLNGMPFSNNRGRDTGGSLEYKNDSSSSYSAIFSNVVGKGSESDYQRVIAALKALSEGRDLEEYFSVGKTLRYLAAHTIVVNLDSYSSSMAQNFYIYEADGKITILPWDYNLSWGGFQSGSASSVINFPIDTPVSGVEMSARPLIEKLFANEEYLSQYHSYLQQLVDEYFSEGKFEGKIKELDELINEYVKNDSTAFCTYEEYQRAVSTFITLGNLRAESLQGQLNGTIPSTTEGQTNNPAELVSGGDVNLNNLGSMMGGGRQQGQGDVPEWNRPMGENPQDMGALQDKKTQGDFGISADSQMEPLDNADGNPVAWNYVMEIGVLLLVLMGAIWWVAQFRNKY